jgi:Sulfotransferase family.
MSDKKFLVTIVLATIILLGNIYINIYIIKDVLVDHAKKQDRSSYGVSSYTVGPATTGKKGSIRNKQQDTTLNQDDHTAASTVLASYSTFNQSTIHSSKHPKVNQGDFPNEVYVNEEYRIIFFPVAKVACTEWLRFFLRLNNSPLWCTSGYQNGIHSAKRQGIKFITDYTLEEQTDMMTSQDWTRAIFVREPKKRIFSAFLDKTHNKDWSNNFCPHYASLGGNKSECIERRYDFDFFVRKLIDKLSTDPHWMPCYDYIDEKWWPYMTFISTMENVRHDAQILLKSVKSSVDGVSAWDRIGRDGWGGDFKKMGCNDAGVRNNTVAFLEARPEGHKTDADNLNKEKKHYTRELEMIIEERYAKDLHNPYYHFPRRKIINQ